jgi:hypothetical protein
MSARMRILVCTAFLVGGAERTYAQGFAVRGGANVNPDQMYGGAQYETRLTDRVWLQPGADLGVGNGAKLFTVNGDIVYRRALSNRGPWQLVAGGGPSINVYKMPSYTTTEAGVGVLAGLRHANGLFTELRVVFNNPDLRFGVGYRFGARAARTTSPRTRPRR